MHDLFEVWDTLQRKVAVQIEQDALDRECAPSTIEGIDAAENFAVMVEPVRDMTRERRLADAADAPDDDGPATALQEAVANLPVLAPPPIKPEAELRQGGEIIGRIERLHRARHLRGLHGGCRLQAFTVHG